MTAARCATTVVVAVALASLSACGRQIPEPRPGEPTSTATAPARHGATPSSASSGARASPEQRARREIITLVEKYYAVDEAIAANPRVPLKRYYEVAQGDYAQSLLQAAQAQRAKGYQVIGKVKVGAPEVRGLLLPHSNGDVPGATVRVCLDVSGVNVVDKEGKSVVEPGRPSAYIETLSLKKRKYGWRITDGANRETSKCDG
jgi:hypothetical protein